nr:MAG TPA: hypothetical protein [Caudoviricetes sp.]
MAKSTLTTINQIMSIASKAHYMNGGNASKILAKDKKGIFTIEQVAETLQCDPAELKQVLQQNQIMCGDYVIAEEWGDGEKLSTFALRRLNDTIHPAEAPDHTNRWVWGILIFITLFGGANGFWAACIIFILWQLYKKYNA